MSKTAVHTPTPWFLNEEEWIVYAKKGTGEPGICSCSGEDLSPLSDDDEIEANARLIVTAVNSHSVLVEALRDIVQRMQRLDAEQGPELSEIRRRYWGRLQENAERALALAEEQE